MSLSVDGFDFEEIVNDLNGDKIENVNQLIDVLDMFAENPKKEIIEKLKPHLRKTKIDNLWK